MARPSNIDAEAIRLLEQANWPWSDLHMAFIEARDTEQETIEGSLTRPKGQVNSPELWDHGLAGSASMAEREAGLQWLRGRLHAASTDESSQP
jgi:hypothetical protein